MKYEDMVFSLDMNKIKDLLSNQSTLISNII